MRKENILPPDEFQFAFDNGGEDNGGTMDRYTISFMLDNEFDIEYVNAFTNECMSVFSDTEECILLEDVEKVIEENEDSKKDWGKQIEWKDIPLNLRKSLMDRYQLT